MAITVADNFSYQGKKPLDGRDTFATLAAMKAYAEASVYDGCLSYCDEDGKRYEFKSTNTVDPTTGKWREYSSGGGGETYSDFTGATASTAGAHGLVPAPSAGDEGKVLFGNGLWGALPSVDLSGLSPEAFQFSLTEKVVGQWIDGKPLWQKTLHIVEQTEQVNKTYDIQTLVPNLDYVKLHSAEVLLGSGGGNIYFSSPYWADGNYNLTASVSNTQLNIFSRGWGWKEANVTLQYTKTTDSPLPSDVKFAGLLANGTVVYKKTVASGGSAPSGTTLIYRLALLNSTDVVYFTR